MLLSGRHQWMHWMSGHGSQLQALLWHQTVMRFWCNLLTSLVRLHHLLENQGAGLNILHQLTLLFYNSFFFCVYSAFSSIKFWIFNCFPQCYNFCLIHFSGEGTYLPCILFLLNIPITWFQSPCLITPIFVSPEEGLLYFFSLSCPVIFYCILELGVKNWKDVNDIIFLQRMFMFCSDSEREGTDQLDVNMY